MRRHELRISFRKLLYRLKIWLVLQSYRFKTKQHRKPDISSIVKIFRFRKRIFPGLGYLLPMIFAGCITAVLFLTFPPSVSSSMSVPVPELQTGIIISYGEREFGWVESKQAFYALKPRFPADRQWVFTDDLMKEGLEFTAASVRKPEKAVEKTLENIELFTDNFLPGYSIYIGEQPLLALPLREDCEKILNTLIDDYTPKPLDEEEELRDIRVVIEEEPEIRRGIFPKEEIFREEDALRYVKKGTKEEKTYNVVPNDTIWSIAQAHGLTMEEIIRANPEIRPDYIYPGDTISLIVPKPFLTVTTEYTREYNRRIQYRTVVKADPGLYRTEAVTERYGRFGKERITARIRMKNGLLENRETVHTEVLLHPVAAIVRMGTARTPDDVLVASAVLPSGVGVITSHFGPRWGRFHYGIDVSSPMGTPIHAYKEGTVVFTGYDHILGNMVAISHGDELVTRYGHLNSILVKTGQQIMKGEAIGLSGNSGYSTGPHIHFEIRKKGIAVDPLQYLKNLKLQDQNS